MHDLLTTTAESGNALEKKLTKHHGGYMARAKTLRLKIGEAAEFLARSRAETETGRVARAAEEAGVSDRLERLRLEVGLVSRLEREAQETYRARRAELEGLLGRGVRA